MVSRKIWPRSPQAGLSDTSSDPSLSPLKSSFSSDRYGIIDAIVQRSRARGIVEGRGPDSCKLRYLNRSDDVQVGDLVVTSGLDNIFPKGFPVGVVTGVSKSRYGMTQDIDLKPAINPSILEEMFIVIKLYETKTSIQNQMKSCLK